MGHKTIVEDGIDVLVVGAGLGGTGAAWEARFWGQKKKIVIAEKANIDRSGAVAPRVGIVQPVATLTGVTLHGSAPAILLAETSPQATARERPLDRRGHGGFAGELPVRNDDTVIGLGRDPCRGS